MPLTVKEEGVEISFSTMKELSRWAFDVFEMDQLLNSLAATEEAPKIFHVIAELLKELKTHGDNMPRRHLRALTDLAIVGRNVLDEVSDIYEERDEPVSKKRKEETRVNVEVVFK